MPFRALIFSRKTSNIVIGDPSRFKCTVNGSIAAFRRRKGRFMALTDLNTLRPLLERHGFSFSKGLGQNFLINAAVPRRIAEGAAGNVLEIGPGAGCLTYELCSRAEKVVAVELDGRLLPVLEESLSEFSNLTVINADILKTDLFSLFDGRYSVYANLPYYITTPVIMYLLESGAPIDSITVMVQKEVAERFAAKPGDPDYGAITASIGYYAKIERLFSVPAGNFLPRPKVDSAVIRLTRIPPPVPVGDEKILFRVIRAAFAMRRKTLVNNLKQEFSLSKEEGEKLLETLGLEKTVRGERLALADYAKIADEITKRKEE